MALPAYPNAISLNAVNVELGRAATTTISLNDAVVRTLFVKSSGAIAMSDGHGKSNNPFAITGQSAANQTVAVENSNSVAYASVYSPTTSAYTATWEVWMGGGQSPRTISSFSGTLSAGNNNFYGATAIDASFYDYGSGYYGVGGGAYYKFTITRGGVSLNTGFIRVYTVGFHDENCNCGCTNGGSEYQDCSENCCCYDCNGDGITACGDPNDPDYDDSNPPCRGDCNPGDGAACGFSCNTACTNGGSYVCDTCSVQNSYTNNPYYG